MEELEKKYSDLLDRLETLVKRQNDVIASEEKIIACLTGRVEELELLLGSQKPAKVEKR